MQQAVSVPSDMTEWEPIFTVLIDTGELMMEDPRGGNAPISLYKLSKPFSFQSIQDALNKSILWIRRVLKKHNVQQPPTHLLIYVQGSLIAEGDYRLTHGPSLQYEQLWP